MQFQTEISITIDLSPIASGHSDMNGGLDKQLWGFTQHLPLRGSCQINLHVISAFATGLKQSSPPLSPSSTVVRVWVKLCFRPHSGTASTVGCSNDPAAFSGNAWGPLRCPPSVSSCSATVPVRDRQKEQQMATISIRPAPAEEFHCYGNRSYPDNTGLWLRTGYCIVPCIEQNSPGSGSFFLAQRSLPPYLSIIYNNWLLNLQSSPRYWLLHNIPDLLFLKFQKQLKNDC